MYIYIIYIVRCSNMNCQGRTKWCWAHDNMGGVMVVLAYFCQQMVLERSKQCSQSSFLLKAGNVAKISTLLYRCFKINYFIKGLRLYFVCNSAHSLSALFVISQNVYTVHVEIYIYIHKRLNMDIIPFTRLLLAYSKMVYLYIFRI